MFSDGARAWPGPWNHPGQGFVFNSFYLCKINIRDHIVT